MNSFFVYLNRYLTRRKGFYLFLFTLLVAALAYVASGLRIEENLNAIIPEDQRITRISEVFDKSQLADQIIFMLSMEDSTKADPEQLIKGGEQLVTLLEQGEEAPGSIRFKVASDAMMEIYDFIHGNLPLFLDEADYEEIGKMLIPEEIDEIIARGFRTLISPTGMVSGKYILKDPLNLTPLALKKLNSFQLDDEFTVYNSAIFTGDLKYLMIFLDPAHPGSNTKENLKLIQHIDRSIAEISTVNGLTID